jgi:hypothetical protein
MTTRCRSELKMAERAAFFYHALNHINRSSDISCGIQNFARKTRSSSDAASPSVGKVADKHLATG